MDVAYAAKTSPRMKYVTAVTQIAKVSAGRVKTQAPRILNAERLRTEARAVLDPIWSGRYGKEKIGIYRLENVWVADEGVILNEWGSPQPEFPSQFKYHIDRALHCYHAYKQTGHDETVEDDCMILLKPGYANYGHWLVEMLSQLLIAQQQIPNFKPAVYLASNLSPGMKRVALDSLAMFADPPVEIRSYDWIPRRYRSLYVVHGHAFHGPFHSRLVYDLLRRGLYPKQSLLHRAFGPKPRLRRLYVRRGPAHSRRVVNEDAMAAMLGRHGFETVNPESLTFAEQRTLFSEGGITVGAAGAGLTNACWQPTGSVCVALYPESMVDTFFWWVCQNTGVRFVEVRCVVVAREHNYSAWDGDIFVDIEQLDQLLNELIDHRRTGRASV